MQQLTLNCGVDVFIDDDDSELILHPRQWKAMPDLQGQPFIGRWTWVLDSWDRKRWGIMRLDQLVLMTDAEVEHLDRDYKNCRKANLRETI